MSEHERRAFLASGDLLSIAEASELTPYSADYLSLRARSGKLRAVKIGRNWLTTKWAVLEYLKQQQEKHERRSEILAMAQRQAGFISLRAALGFLIAAAIFTTGMASLAGRAGTRDIPVLAPVWDATDLGRGMTALNTPAGSNRVLAGLLSHADVSDHAKGSVLSAFVKGGSPQAAAQALQPRGSAALTEKTLSQGAAAPGQAPAAGNSKKDLSQVLSVLVGKPAAIKSVTNRQLYAVSTSVSPAKEQGRVLGASTSVDPNYIAQLVSDLFNQDMASSQATGTPQYVPAAYFPVSNQSQSAGGSVAGVTNLSSQNFVSDTAGFNRLQVYGDSNVNNLTVSGNTNLVGTTTISSLVVTDFNPNLSIGSVGFQGVGGLAEDAPNFHWDNSSHRLGIGTTTPQFSLDVNGILNASALYVNGVPYNDSQWSSSGSNIYFDTGNVGIGTSTPLALVHAYGPSAQIRVQNTLANTTASWMLGDPVAGAYFSASQFSYGATTTYWGLSEANMSLLEADGNSSSMVINEKANGPLILGTNNQERMRIDSNGNVAIGTTLAAQKLDIDGTAANLRVRGNTSGTTAGYFTQIGTATYLTQNAYATDGFGSFGTDMASTSASAIKLDQGSISLNLAVAPETNPVTWTQALNIISPGFVGIGTASPAYPLDVIGDIRSSTCVRYSGGTSGVCSSDQNIKKNIANYQAGLEELAGLNAVTYQYNGLAGNPDDGQTNFGFIAQQVQGVAPELVGTVNLKLHPTDATTTSVMTVNYSALSYMELNSIKQLNDRTSFASATSSSGGLAAIFVQASDALKAGIASIGSQVVHMFKDVIYAATGVFNKLFAQEVHTDTLCVGSTCVSQSQFLQMVQTSGAAASPPVQNVTPPDSGSGTSGDTMGSAGQTTDSGSSGQ